ncbi:YceI family protein [Streptomyces sp. NPDC002643]
MIFGLLRHTRGVLSNHGAFPPVPSGAGTVSCTVVDPVGLPLPGAAITVADHPTGQEVMTGTSDPYGGFMAALPPGGYSVLITADGMEPVRAGADIVAGSHCGLGEVRLLAAPLKQLPTPGTWVFDPPHTAVRFIATHIGRAHVHGRFTRFDGSIAIAECMEDSKIDVTIDATSISTGSKTRDNHLRSSDFLDTARYPYIHFASERFVPRHGSRWTVAGVLTLHGVSRSVHLDTVYRGTTEGGYGRELRCAAFATAELHRDDFGLNWRSMLARGINIVGPTVKVELDVQAMFETPNMPSPPD